MGNGDSSTNLIPEMIYEIVLRLPVKLVVKCMSVCKSWRSFITNSRFIHSYFARTVESANQDRVLFVHGIRVLDGEDMYCFHDTRFAHVHTVNFPLTKTDTYSGSITIGTGAGLICLMEFHRKNLIFRLWNPSIRKILMLPYEKGLHPLFHPNVFIFGFGFNHKKNDLNVVCIIGPYNTSECHIYIYSLAAGSWRIPFVTCQLKNMGKGDSSSVFVNGILHWIAVPSEMEDPFISFFDMDNEVLGELVMPQAPCRNGVGVLNHMDKLSIFQRDGSCIRLWVLFEYSVPASWALLFVSDLQFSDIDQLFAFRSVYVWKTRENHILMLMTSYGNLFRLNTNTNECQFVSTHDHVALVSVEPFVETLYLLEKDDVISY